MLKPLLLSLSFVIGAVAIVSRAEAQPSEAQLARLEKIIQALPQKKEREDGMRSLALLLARYGHAARAEKLGTELKGGNDEWGFRLRLMHALIDGSAYAAAGKIAKTLWTDTKDQAIAYFEIAEAQLARGQKTQAAATLKEARAAVDKIDYKRFDLVRLGKLQAAAGLTKEAAQTLEALRSVMKSEGERIAPEQAKSPGSYDGYYGPHRDFADLLAAAGRMDEAKVNYAKAVKEAASDKDVGERAFGLSDIAMAQRRSTFSAEADATLTLAATAFSSLKDVKDPAVGYLVVAPEFARALAQAGRAADAAEAIVRVGDVIRLSSFKQVARKLLVEGRIPEVRALLDQAGKLAALEKNELFATERDWLQWGESMRAVLAGRSGQAKEMRDHALKAIELARKPAGPATASRIIEHWSNVALIPELARKGEGTGDLVAQAWDEIVKLVETPPPGCCQMSADVRLSGLEMYLRDQSRLH